MRSINRGLPRQRNLIFEGNSLSNRYSGGSVDGGHYIPVTVYDNVKSGRALAFTSYAISARNQTQINAAISTNINPFVKYNDVVVAWEGTNDMYTNALSGAAAYANLLSYAQTIRSLGAKIIVCTVIARDYSLDAADLMTRIDDYNVLVRANSAEFDGTCDLAANANFDTRADASNLTYYNADKIHQALGGQDLVITLLTTTVTTVLNL